MHGGGMPLGNAVEKRPVIYAGYGNGSPCDVCRKSIRPDEVEYELRFDTGSFLRVHIGCYTESGRDSSAATTPSVATPDATPP